jgi:Spy/CpxP family protein refolding chaperone
MMIKVLGLAVAVVCICIPVCTLAQSNRTAHVPGGSGPVTSGSPLSGATGDVSVAAANSDAKVDRDPREEAIWNAARQLELTQDQRAGLGVAMKADKPDRIALERGLQEARRALADALANGDSFLDSEIENLASATAKLQESELKMWAKLYSVLSPDQQRRMLSMSTPLSMVSGSHEFAKSQ